MSGRNELSAEEQQRALALRYPKYYKLLQGMEWIDVYGVHMIFEIQDASGCIQHASKKLLLSGVRTGGKTKFDDIREARDTLTRWLGLHANEALTPETSQGEQSHD